MITQVENTIHRQLKGWGKHCY